MSRAGRRTWLALALAAVLLPSACLSPTLPLPPPSRPDSIEGPDEHGYVRLMGTVPPRARVDALNETLEVGTFQFTRDDGRYDFSLPARPGDQILLSYSLDRDESPTIRFEIPAPVP